MRELYTGKAPRASESLGPVWATMKMAEAAEPGCAFRCGPACVNQGLEAIIRRELRPCF
jgi:hypothetical protein